MAVYIFFDESGNLDFSTNGTKYYFFGALTTRNPRVIGMPLDKLRYEILAQGLEIEYFHASEDRQIVRDQVFNCIISSGEFEYDCVIIEKRKLNPILHSPEKFYPKFADYLLQYIFKRYINDGDEIIIIITDVIPVKKKRKAVEKAFKMYINRHLKNRKHLVLHHKSASHAGLQAADYCNWAIQRKWKNGDPRSYDIIKGFITSELDILKRGAQYFY